MAIIENICLLTQSWDYQFIFAGYRLLLVVTFGYRPEPVVTD